MAGGLFGQEPFVDAGDPGVYILHGVFDETVPFTEVGFLQDALTAAGVPFESRIHPSAGHGSSTLRSHLLGDPDPFFEFMADQLGVVVPEPSSVLLAAFGLAALVGAYHRGRRRQRQTCRHA